MIYADNATTSKLHLDTFESMMLFLLKEYSNASQPYSFSRNNKKALKETCEIIASCKIFLLMKFTLYHMVQKATTGN